MSQAGVLLQRRRGSGSRAGWGEEPRRQSKGSVCRRGFQQRGRGLTQQGRGSRRQRGFLAPGEPLFGVAPPLGPAPWPRQPAQPSRTGGTILPPGSPGARPGPHGVPSSAKAAEAAGLNGGSSRARPRSPPCPRRRRRRRCRRGAWPLRPDQATPLCPPIVVRLSGPAPSGGRGLVVGASPSLDGLRPIAAGRTNTLGLRRPLHFRGDPPSDLGPRRVAPASEAESDCGHLPERSRSSRTFPSHSHFQL